MRPRQDQAEANLVGEKYEIKSHKVSDDYLDVYVVADAHGACYEAQAFAPVTEMPREREGLRQARRRRMRRICGSPNFADEFEHGGRRFLVSRVQRSVKEWGNLQRLSRGRCASEEQEVACGKQHEEHECRGADLLALNQQQGKLSYAEAASRDMKFTGGLDTQAGRKRMCLTLGSPKGFKRYMT
ncbi:hypothetical protein LZ30DRAFT_7403 [Colletotrichum cereale]|nr:hypothetical protein LZ30DRAFT_7403 [Colletotrichum cereale]